MPKLTPQLACRLVDYAYATAGYDDENDYVSEAEYPVMVGRTWPVVYGIALASGHCPMVAKDLANYAALDFER
jgi:hypothetical protein